LKSAIKKVNKWFLLTGSSFLPSFWDNHPVAEPPNRYVVKFIVNFSTIKIRLVHLSLISNDVLFLYDTIVEITNKSDASNFKITL